MASPLRERLRHRDRAAAGRAARARDDLAADERAHAYGLGARGVVPGRRPRARGHGPARPVADDPAPPRPRGARDEARRLDEHECFPTGGHETCAESVRIWLRGETAKAPASVVAPLQIADLPAFLRWRGRLPFGSSRPRAADRRSRPADRRFERVGRPARRPPYRRLPELFDQHRRLRPRLGARASVPRRARRALALRGEACSTCAGRAPTPCSSRPGSAPG